MREDSYDISMKGRQRCRGSGSLAGAAFLSLGESHLLPSWLAMALITNNDSDFMTSSLLLRDETL